jgi:hypothetical protein
MFIITSIHHIPYYSSEKTWFCVLCEKIVLVYSIGLIFKPYATHVIFSIPESFSKIDRDVLKLSLAEVTP